VSADRLREAASVLRYRAEKATPGPWHSEGKLGQAKDICAEPGVLRGVGRDLAVAERVFGRDANYILMMHPSIGIALADWLDVEAEHITSHDCEAHCEPDGCDRSNAACVVAALIVGGAS
jgi:hypothetical protein